MVYFSDLGQDFDNSSVLAMELPKSSTNDLLQDCANSSALAMELLKSSIKPAIYEWSC